MASVEQRATDCRVVWRQQGAKQFEKFDSAGDAERFRLLVEAHGNQWPPGWVKGLGWADKRSNTPLFSQWAPRSIAARSRASARTRSDYERDLRLHLLDPFGQMPLDQITREMVGTWLIDLSRKRSAKTVKNVHNLASSIMDEAVQAGLVHRNVFKGAVGAIPNVKHEEMVFLSRPEYALFEAGVDEFYRPLVRTLAMTGCRWSEATALQLHDVDLQQRRIRIVRAWKRTPDNYFVIGEPKSVRSRRTVPFPASLLPDLIGLVEGRVDPAGWLFQSPRHRPVRHANFRERVWLPTVRALQEAGVAKQPRIHDLRHSHASWLIAAGVPLPAIQRRLGHESITTTIDRYGHLAPEMDDVISAALDDS